MKGNYVQLSKNEIEFLRQEFNRFTVFELYMLRNSFKTKIDLEGIHYDLNCIKHESRNNGKKAQYNINIGERLHDEEVISLIDETLATILNEFIAQGE